MSASSADILPDTQAGIARAAELLREGKLVAVPTETVYGLAARADSAEAVAAIYRTKGRPDFNPLIVHVASLEQAGTLVALDARARLLAETFWPGPLTMVLPLKPGAPVTPAVTAGLATLAIRSPAHPLTRSLLARLGLPVAAPSANRSLGVSPTRPDHVAASFGEACPPILDGGECTAGVESTIIALRPHGGWNLLRPGPVTREELAAVLGEPDSANSAGIEAPGQLSVHYSPGKPVRLNATSAEPDEYWIGFGKRAGAANLSPTGDLAEAAARLYACLHDAAQDTRPRIAIAPIPATGMGVAINDRLTRAAAIQG